MGSTRVIWRRATAHVIDNALPVFAALAIAAALDSAAAFFVLLVVLQVGELVVLQGLTGLTPGKWLCGIRVVDAHGGPPGIGGAIKRSIPLLFEWTALIGLIAIMRDPHGQRIGDRWAGTYVVRAPRQAAAPRPAGVVA
ncbi:MAG TPA: RDD family protein [Thermoleophilaceae bacterium]|jgi:uncharacterized RDD family membrane protein YckC